MTTKYPKDKAVSKGDEFTKHLCYIVSQGLNISDEQEYNELVKNSQFKCQQCGRMARNAESLCEPMDLELNGY